MLRFWRRNYNSVAHPDFEPHSVIKVLSSSKSSKKHEDKDASEDKAETPSSAKTETRNNVNEMGIQMISKNLFQQIFKNSNASSADQNLIEK